MRRVPTHTSALLPPLLASHWERLASSSLLLNSSIPLGACSKNREFWKAARFSMLLFLFEAFIILCYAFSTDYAGEPCFLVDCACAADTRAAHDDASCIACGHISIDVPIPSCFSPAVSAQASDSGVIGAITNNTATSTDAVLVRFAVVYQMFSGVHIMIFIGFGFLMTVSATLLSPPAIRATKAAAAGSVARVGSSQLH